MAETEQDKAATYGGIIAKAWSDPAFKAKLLADPHAALKDVGVSVAAGVTVTVVEDTDTQFHFVLPPKPTRELSVEELDKVSAGGPWDPITYDRNPPLYTTTGNLFGPGGPNGIQLVRGGPG